MDMLLMKKHTQHSSRSPLAPMTRQLVKQAVNPATLFHEFWIDQTENE